MSEGWDSHQIIKFINLFRDYPLIWDKSCKNYTCKPRKELAYEEIAQKMGITKDEAKRKIHSLRTNYSAELRKMLIKSDYIPVWKYFDALRFMFKHENAVDDPLNEFGRGHITKSFEGLPETILGGEQRGDSTIDSLDETNNEDRIVEQYINSNESDIDSDDCEIESKDEYHVFGEYVANELRLLNDFKPIQLALKCKILRALLEANEALHRTGWNEGK